MFRKRWRERVLISKGERQERTQRGLGLTGLGAFKPLPFPRVDDV